MNDTQTLWRRHYNESPAAKRFNSRLEYNQGEPEDAVEWSLFFTVNKDATLASLKILFE